MKPSVQKDGEEAYKTNIGVDTVHRVKQLWTRYEKVSFRSGYTPFRSRMVRAA